MRIDEADRPTLPVAALALLVIAIVLPQNRTFFSTAVALLCLISAYCLLSRWEDALRGDQE